MSFQVNIMKAIFKYILLFILILILFFIGCEGDSDLLSADDNDKNIFDHNYPFTIMPLSTQMLNELQTEFDNLNENQLCSKLNKYGFTISETYCRSWDSVTTNEETALRIAKNVILKNSKFTNVIDYESLNSCRYFISRLSGDKWKVRFEQQNLDGLQIISGKISVRIYGGEPYSIDGNWYRSVYIPLVNNISKEDAQRLIIGEKIYWVGFSGLQEFIIKESSIDDKIEKVICPWYKEEQIEMRVIWKIPIKIDKYFVGWYAYVDTTIGEILTFAQQFVPQYSYHIDSMFFSSLIPLCIIFNS